MKLRIISLILCAVTMASLAACAKQSADSDSGNGSATDSSVNETEQVTEPETDPRASYPDTLGDDLNFEGDDYIILCRNNLPLWKNEFFAESETGEIVNDAIYTRNSIVSDRLNVKIATLPVDWNAMNSTITKSVRADDKSFDIVAGYAFFITPMVLTDCFQNLYDFPYINYKMPWWPDSIIKNLNINNKLYFIAGEVTPTMISYLNCLLFSKKLANDWNVPDLYELVTDGKWTFDKYIEVVNMVGKDLNGDSEYDQNDIYGLGNMNFDVLFPAFDMRLTEVDENGDLTCVVYNERFVDAYDKLYRFMNESTSVYPMARLLKDGTESESVFMEDRMLIWGVCLEQCEKLRNMNTDYGILPYPKYDEMQEKYQTVSHDNYSLLCVPETSDNTELIGATTEALAAESYRRVTPAYYEAVIKEKYSRDSQSKKMLDLIIGGNTFEPAIIYSYCLADGGIGNMFRYVYLETEDITAHYQSLSKVIDRTFKKFNEYFSK